MPSSPAIWTGIFETLGKSLACSQPQEEFQSTIASMERNLELLGDTIEDRNFALCCVGALWLKADYFDRAHQIFQDMDNQTGSLWHGISHRREGDFGNANYWFSRCGNHPAGYSIAQYLAKSSVQDYPSKLIQSGRWDFKTMNRLAESENESGSPSPMVLKLQDLEWQGLFLWTLEQSTRKPS